MAIASIRYDVSAEVNESRSGVLIYDGSAAKYHEWSFRTSMRMSSQKDEDMPNTMSMIIDARRGDSAQIAMDIGAEELLKKGGYEELDKRVKDYVFPHAHAETKELYRAGHKSRGVLARQAGEPMHNFITHRKRWWRLLKKLDDSSLSKPEGIYF